DDGVDLRRGERAVVRELAIARVGTPGGHLAALDLRFDRLRPRPYFLIRQQRHRRDLAWAMAARALVEDDGRNILCEGWTRRCCGAGGIRGQSRNDPDPEEPRFHHVLLRETKKHIRSLDGGIIRTCGV